MIPIILIFIALIIFAAIMQGNSNIDNFEKKYNKKISELIVSGTYVSGHHELDNAIKDTSLLLDQNEVKIFSIVNTEHSIRATIPKNAITNVAMEDSSTIQSRVGVKRLLLTGIFAFAWKKKVKLESAYFVVEWKFNQFENETIFEFEGANSIQKANKLRNRFISYLSVLSEPSIVVADIPTTDLDQYKNLISKGRDVEAVNLYIYKNKCKVKEALDYIESIK